MFLFVILLVLLFAGSYSVSGTAIGSNELNSSIPRSHRSVAGVPGRQINQGVPAVISRTVKPNSVSFGGSLMNVTAVSPSPVSRAIPRHLPCVEHCPDRE